MEPMIESVYSYNEREPVKLRGMSLSNEKSTQFIDLNIQKKEKLKKYFVLSLHLRVSFSFLKKLCLRCGTSRSYFGNTRQLNH